MPRVGVERGRLSDRVRRRLPLWVKRPLRRAVNAVRARIPRRVRRSARSLFRGGDLLPLSLLLLLTVGLGVLTIAFDEWFPASTLAVPIILAGLLVRLSSLAVLLAVTAVVLGYSLLANSQAAMAPGIGLIFAVAVAVTLVISRTRSRLGVSGPVGESMLIDLRDRLRAQAKLPTPEPGWKWEPFIRAADGVAFSGDFIVAATTCEGRVIEIAVVDVSGKGVDAGSRALLLAGAFGALIGSVSDDEFLPAANAYLLRLGWTEGFATAAHLVLDLRTGEYTLLSAGHPPALHLRAGSGRWSVVEAEGPLLGVLPDAKFIPAQGQLGQGDAFMLYTDGLIEDHGRDMSQGIDKLLGHAERLVADGFRGGAKRLVRAAGGDDDDRALVLVRRR